MTELQAPYECVTAFREWILGVEAVMSKYPGAQFGDDCAPLEHAFGDGLYIRKITMPANKCFTSKIHKKAHPYFVMQGDALVQTEDGIVRITAPFAGMTKPGTKRLLRILEETVWITVHATQHTDLKLIEDEIIASSFEEFDAQEVTE
jgi:hypothetical protein